VSLGVRQICFLLVPAAAVSAALAEPIVRLLYQRGEFTPDQTSVVASALAAFALGLTFNGIMLMLNRAFFSLQSPWIPTAVALGNLGVNVAADAVLYHVGVWGIPFATSIVNVTGAGALALIFRRRVGPLEGRRIVDAFWRILVAASIATGVAYGLWYALDRALGQSLGAQLVSLGAALLAGIAAYALSARLLAIRELDALLGLWRRRSGPGRDGAPA